MKNKTKFKGLTVVFTGPTIISLVVDEKEIGSSDCKICRKEMYISDFNIEYKYRDCGYGHFLARFMVNLAKLKRCTVVRLIDGSTHENFWQSMGFVDSERYSNQVELNIR